MALHIGIDLGGTKIAGAVVDEDGTILARRTIASETLSRKTVVSGISKLIDELSASAPGVVSVGVGAAGLVDDTDGVILTSPNLPVRNLPLKLMLSHRCGLPVMVENDANAAAYGECLIGAGKGASPVVCVTVGTGIGGGVVVGGKLLGGRHGFAGELGHIQVSSTGPRCGCGQVGCLEAFASGTGIVREAQRRMSEESGAPLREAVGPSGHLDGQTVMKLAASGDELCAEIVNGAGNWLGVGLVALANLLDPERIVIGGGAGIGFGELLLAPAEAVLKKRILGAGDRKPPDVVLAALGLDAGVIGAALLASRHEIL